MDSKWKKLLKMSQPRIFPDITMFDILSRLPVKSILRFKSVSKAWNALFADSQFIQAHLNHSDDCCLVRKYNYCFKEPATPKGAVFSLRSEDDFEELCELQFEPDALFSYRIVSSAGGLVCIKKGLASIKKYDYTHQHIFDETSFDLYIWNPATMESRTLSKIPAQDYSFEVSLGFGYDSENDDYKVVGISSSKYSSIVHVYSLRFDRWKTFEVDSLPQMSPTAVDVNGRMHWLNCGDPRDFIVSFDVAEERIIMMDVPELAANDYISLRKPPASLEKSLILCNCGLEEGGLQIWFMKEYGDSRSWTILHHFRPHPIYGKFMYPVVFLEDGKIILQYNGDTVLHDPNNQVDKILNIDGHVPVDVVNYKKSLVSVRRDGSLNHCPSISSNSMG